jgi:hypothetical protein
MNNKVLGMVRQWQTLFFGGRYSNTVLSERKTDYVKLAEAFGAVGYRATTAKEFEEAFKKAFALNRPVVIDTMIDKVYAGITIAFTADAQGTLASVTLSYADGPGRVSATVSKDGINVEYVVSGDDMPAYDIEFTIVTNNAIEPDGTKLAEIKAKIASIPELSVDILRQYFEEYYDADSIYFDEATGTLYHHQHYGSYATDAGYIINYRISAFNVDTLFALLLLDSCTNAIDVQYTIGRQYQSVEFYFESYEVAEVTDDMIMGAIKDFYADEFEPDTMTFIYNTETQTFGFDSCHDYVFDEENSVYSDACGGMNKGHYVCSVCGKYYDDYFSNGHDTEIIAETVDGVTKLHLTCSDESCDYVGKYVANVTVNSVETLTPTDIIEGDYYYGRTPFVAYECDIDTNDELFSFTISSDSYDFTSVCINVFAYDEENDEYVLLSNTNVYDDDSYTAHIHNTYDKVYIVIAVYDNDIEYNSSNVEIGIEIISAEA